MPLTRIQKEREQFVVKSNDLIQKYRNTLSAEEQKIILYLISKIVPSDTQFRVYEFKIADFCNVFGIECRSGGNYKMIKDLAKGLVDKSLWMKLPTGKIATVHWIEKSYMDDIEGDPYMGENGTIQLKLDKDMMPFLLNLKNNFTKYLLIYTAKMKSQYSIRLFELLRSHHYDEFDVYKLHLSIGYLREQLGAVKKTYNNFKDFRVSILEKSIAEINKYTDMTVSYTPIKDGGKIAYIDFTISTKDVLNRMDAYTQLEKELNRNILQQNWER